jgi:quercetin dioxygenase-like cupin family protein
VVITSAHDEGWGITMKSWDINALGTEAHKPQIISSSPDSRAIVLYLPAGERMKDHEVKERAWVVVVAGETEFTAADGTTATGGPGLAIELEPHERHEVLAISDARFLLLLTPWPAHDHAGTMTLERKADVRARAAERARATE